MVLIGRARTAAELIPSEEIPDPESVHAFRVALRRARSILKPLDVVYDKFHVRYLRSRLKLMAESTSALRDEEVLLEFMNRPGLDIPRSLEEEFITWIDVRKNREQALRANLKETLKSDVMLFPLEELKSLVILPVNPKNDPGVGKFSHRITMRAIKSLKKDVKRFDKKSSEILWLHELRLKCKYVRYTVDFYRPLLRNSQIGAGAFARFLQNKLGNLHDFDFIAENVRAEVKLSPGLKGFLLDTLEQERQALRIPLSKKIKTRLVDIRNV